MDDDNDEVQGFILPSAENNRFTIKPERKKASSYSQGGCVSRFYKKGCCRFATTSLVLLVAASISVFFVLLMSAPRHLLGPVDQTSQKSGNASVPEKNEGSGPIMYSCPKQIGTLLDFDARDYEEKAKQITDDMTEYLDTFRNGTFDNWGYSYNEVKAQMSPFKKKYFPLFLSMPNPTLYESAAGVGLNLFMTLELLEQQGITGVTIYGNEYVEASTSRANALFDHMVPGKGYKGTICQADSTKLDQFVPADSFDVVFTGYISPILDPLNFDLGEYKLMEPLYLELCNAEPSDWKGIRLNALAQQIQNDWYGKWIAQMTRLAKPGGAIMIEQVSTPLCETRTDWGGVSRNPQWWERAIDVYGWDVNPSSIRFEGDTLFRGRYHVFMRKNEK